MPNAEVIIAVPLMDIPTIISTTAGDALVKYARNRGWNVTYLFGLAATRPALESSLWFRQMISKKSVAGIFYLGHGLEDSWLGNHYFWRLVDLANVGHFKDKVIWNMACLTGKELAPVAIQRGAKAFFGHLTYFYAAFNESYHNFMDDWVDYVLSPVRALLDHKTCGEAMSIYRETVEKYLVKYAQLKSEFPDEEIGWYISSARDNLRYFKLFGDRDATL
jgi:hypothetical protein